MRLEGIHPPSVCYPVGYCFGQEGLNSLGRQCRRVSVIPPRKRGNPSVYSPISTSHWDGCYQGEVGWWGIKFPALSVHFVLHTGKVDTSGYRKPSTRMSWFEMEARVNV